VFYDKRLKSISSQAYPQSAYSSKILTVDDLFSDVSSSDL